MTDFFEFAFNFTNSTTDALVIVIFVCLFLGSIFIFSYRRIINNVISIYVTAALINGVSASHRFILGTAQLNNDPNYMTKVVTFGVITAALFMFVSWGVSERGGHDDSANKRLSNWWKIITLSFFQAGLLFTVILNYFDPFWASSISWSIRRVFISETAKIIWFLLPMVFLTIVSKLFNKDAHSSGHGHH